MTRHVILGAGPVAHAIVGALLSRPGSPAAVATSPGVRLGAVVETARLNVMPRLRHNRPAA